jgi:hypothetical protein
MCKTEASSGGRERRAIESTVEGERQRKRRERKAMRARGRESEDTRITINDDGADISDEN